MILNFPAKPLYNPGGYKGFKFAPAIAIINNPEITDGVITEPFSFLPNFDWLTGYATAGTLIFKENGQNVDNGKIYTQEITGFVPGDKPELIDLMDAMQGKPFLVTITDKMGKTRVVGADGYHLIFSADFNSGGNRPDAKGYTFKFVGESILRAPVYNP